MPKQALSDVTFDMVRRSARALPDVEEGTAWRLPAFRTGGKLFLCFREDLGAIVVRAPFEQRDAMIESDPDTYFTTDHHRPHPWVLARISALHADAVPDLLRMGWRTAREESGKRRRSRDLIR